MMIDLTIKRQKETRYQVVLYALVISTCYLAILIMAEDPIIYMHQFWHTFSKHGSFYRFKIDNKKFIMIAEEFKDILNICPRIKGQEFFDPSYEEEALSFIRHLGHTVRSTRDDTKLGILKFVSKYEDIQVYGALIPKEMTNADIRAYKYKKQRKSESKSSKETSPRNEDKDDDDENGTKVVSDDDREEISDDNKGCDDDNVKDDDDDSDKNVDDDDEMTELYNDEEDIKLDEKF
nr:hypothetical protein [Tanacetum cinerariifolium]